MLKAIGKGLAIIVIAVLLLAYVLFNPTYVNKLTFEGDDITIVRN